MAMTPTNWPLASYTNSVWTSLVDEAAVVTSIVMTNTGASSVNVEMRLYDVTGAASLAMLLASSAVAAGESFVFDSRALVVMADQAIQVRADAQDMEFLASGAV